MYKLVNPHIEGTFDPTINGPNYMEAAAETWKKLSKYITNSLPEFAFSLEDTSSGKVRHFVVKETMHGGNDVKWTVDKMDLKLDNNARKQFKQGIDKVQKKSGGRRHNRKHRRSGDDEDDSSSSSDEYFSAIKLYKSLNKYQPITYWWYDPWVYNLNNLYIPTFSSPLNPTVEYTTVYYV